MASVVFKRIASDAEGFALYAAEGATDALVQASFLLLPGGVGTPAATLAVQDAWQQPGWFLFSPVAQPLPQDLQGIASLLGLSTPYGTSHGVAWLKQVTQEWRVQQVALQWQAPSSGQVAVADGALDFGHVVLSLPMQTPWAVLPDASRAIFQSPYITLLRGGQGTSLVPDNGTVALSFATDSAGQLSFTAHWDPYNLFSAFADDPAVPGLQGGELRFFYNDPDAANGVAQLRYPVLPPLGADDWPLLALDCTLDPLAPLDGARTRFLFQPQPVAHLVSTFGRTVGGDAVTFTPCVQAGGARAGLYPAARPGNGDSPAAYLAPLGPFTLDVPGGSAKLACGLLGTEYMRVSSGDIIDFVPSMPAAATGFGADGARRVPLAASADPSPPLLLAATYATSWLQFLPGNASGPRGYFAQPGASVSFGRGAVTSGMTYPAAVSALIVTYGAASGPDNARAVPSPVIPMVPYGGVFALADGSQQDPALLARFERQVIANQRGGLIRGAAPTAPVFVDEQSAALPCARTATPQGLLVQLNAPRTGATALAEDPAPPAGTWGSLLLAQSASQTLSFDADPASGIVDPHLASTLMREELFLVLNDWSRFPYISRMINVAGFNFEIAPDAAAVNPRRTVLVFKYATSMSLADLIDAPESWADPGYYIGDTSQVAQAQAVLIKALAIAQAAEGGEDDPFADFRAKAAAPSWTGMLAFNAPINGNGMPDDLQMLLAGIDGQLSAHHFGVQANRITTAGNEPQISESSLFGVIYYHAPPPPAPRPAGGSTTTADYSFEVEELSVAIRQSLVSQFHCKVGMTINRLFGREVTLVDTGAPSGLATNTVIVAGRYQRRGEVGTVTFDGGQHGRFQFNPEGTRIRALDGFEVSAASLVPVASTPAASAAVGDKGDGATLASRFALAGTLIFAPDPFPGVTGLDLFSYGVAGKAPSAAATGLSVSSVAFDIATTLDSAGKRTAPPTITADMSGLQATDDGLGQRDGSLARMLPLKLQGMLHNEDGLDIKALGALPVQVPALTSVASSIPASGGVKALPTQVAYLTSKPQFALQFKLPLGTLGGLADAHASLDAGLVIAWGASSYTPDDDGVAVFVQLPQVTAGAFGFELQGLLKTTFSGANLGMVTGANGPAYVLMFNNVALSVLGITLPPKVLTDFILFADPKNATGGNLGWSLAATQVP